MEIRLAETAGFCFGVERAVQAVEKALLEQENLPPEKRSRVFTYGPIVHNEFVVDSFAKKGVKVLNEEDLFSDSMIHELKEFSFSTETLKPLPLIVIRAHGIPERAYCRMEELGFSIVDASCPFVRKIQKLVREKTMEGRRVFLAGDPNHPEVKGIVGWAKGPVTVISDPDEALNIEEGKKKEVFLLAQTTFNTNKFKEVIDILEKKRYYVNVINTICNATLQRQTEAKDLAGRSDLMIVIGGSSSSNTKKLFEICRAECQYTRLIQTVKDLQFERDEAIRNVGITAGASTPKQIIEEVLTYVRNEFRTNA